MEPCGVYSTSYKNDLAVIRTPLQWIALVCFLIILFGMPKVLSRYWIGFLNLTAITLISVIGANIVTGYCGQITLGQSAFMAVGAYSSVILATRLGLQFWLVMPCAGFISGLIGLTFALPSLKIKGFYLAMVTLGAHFLIIWIISHATPLTGGTFGITFPPAKFLGIIFDTDKNCYYLIIIVTLFITFFSKNLARTRTGRAFVAIRDNDLSAELLGINVYFYKLLAFFLSSFIAGIAGSLLAYWLTSLCPEQFPLIDSIWHLSMAIIGGMGTCLGPILGTVFVRLLNEVVLILSPMIGSTFPLLGANIFASFGNVVFGLTLILFSNI